jgi:hypothetical protein
MQVLLLTAKGQETVPEPEDRLLMGAGLLG